ncbi:DNA gyrase subunit A [Heyndrickxia sporothermodurans]|uniref:DNA gyrase subunit A n=1 Tax=Heyndrickxia sporothermodurans TaxID=46224 RepID=UPI0013FD307A|nr:DNA gyrase subunit A [Heyndrickxia sporothermodurans]
MTQIIRQDIGEKLADSFLNYAMYVIVDRALPDIRDGLKPVQRRILHDMNELGLHHNKAFKKSARTVGDVLGKYHPHGDSSVYEAMVKMAQLFSMRYPLVAGHGNFGSIDGDSAAAMRYTEAKMSLFGETMLRDIGKNTVDFEPNFDESLTEPTVLPTLFPNLLANGTTGIAVSMATSIPPHHAGSLYEAIKTLIRNELEGKETTIDDLIAIVQAPDFPTGGEIINLGEVHKGYRTGKGRVMIRSKYEIEEVKNRQQIVVTEIPYKVNKAKLIEQIDNLRKTALEDIKEIRDESDKDGIRVVIELRKDANANWIIKKLLKQTQLQDSFSMNMVALVNNRPHQFTLKEALEYFLAHAAEVIIRRTQFDLEKAERRRHIVEGILLCLDQIDEVIATIKASKSNPEIVSNLQSNFGLSEEQAKSISDMRLRALSQASHEEYVAEQNKLTDDINAWTDIVSDNTVLLNTMLTEFDRISEIFKDDRKTDISTFDPSAESDRDLVKDEDLVITYTSKGIIKSVSESEFSRKGRGTKGTKATSVKENDSIQFILMLNSRDDLLFFTNQGRCHVIEAFKIPISTKGQAGKYISNYLNLEPDEVVVSVLARNVNSAGSDLLFVTRDGVGKRLELSNLSNTRSTTKVISFRDNDELVSVTLFEKGQEVLLLTAKGQGVRFNPDAEGGKGMRPMGRSAVGVNAVNLVDGDYVVGTTVISEGEDLFLVTENGTGKRTSFDQFPTLSRGTKGVRAITVNERTGHLAAVASVKENDDLFIATKGRLVSRISVSGIRPMGRNASGVKVINLNEGDTVTSISKNEEDGDEE